MLADLALVDRDGARVDEAHVASSLDLPYGGEGKGLGFTF